jgi:hypothetical protein
VGVSNVRGRVPFTVNLETLSRYCITTGFLGLDFLVLSLLYALFKKNTFNDIVYLIIPTQKSTFLYYSCSPESRHWSELNVPRKLLPYPCVSLYLFTKCCALTCPSNPCNTSLWFPCHTKAWFKKKIAFQIRVPCHR